MDREELAARRDEVVASQGPWVAYNLGLGDGVHTMGPGLVGLAERMISAVTQLVADFAGGLKGLRILDLGAHEGGYAVELAAHGAEVVAVEGRAQNAAKARFAADALGLDRLSVIEDDVRNLSVETLGPFDVVLCLGILYHLEPADAATLLRQVHAFTTRLAVVRTAIALRPAASVDIGGRTYGGRWYEENHHAGASIGNRRSFWLTQPSLLNLLHEVGFTSAALALNPYVPGIARMADSVTVVAVKGSRVGTRAVPPAAASDTERRPERSKPLAHPEQGWYWALHNRLTHEWERETFGGHGG